MSFKANGLIVIGENFNATRKIKATSPRAIEENGKWGIKYTNLEGEDRCRAQELHDPPYRRGLP